MTPHTTLATALDQPPTIFTHSHLLAEAAQSEHSTGTLVLLVVLAAAYYVIHCAIWPFRACRTCGGTGRSLAPNGKAWRLCRACKGKPARVRFGRRVFDSLRTFKDR